MRTLLQIVGVTLVLQGAAGAVDHLAGGLGFGALGWLNRSGLFDGYQVFANVVLAVLGAALVFGAERVAEGGRK